MNNASFVEILDGLEKDVFDLVSDLERQINSRLSSYGSDARVAPNKPAKPFQPKWRGLRGALRWLWKGHSKDNPDYAHLYDQEAKAESESGRPTLAEYLEYARVMDGFAEEIYSEALGPFLTESSISVSDLLSQFKRDFRNIMLKYKNLIKSAASSAPEVAPPATGQKPATQDVPVQASKPAQNSEPAVPQGSSKEEEGRDSGGQEKDPEEKDVDSEEEDRKISATSPKDDEGKDSSGSSEASSQRKPKSHSANIGRWFKEAMEAKKKGGDDLSPKPEWLNAKGIVKPEKLPWVIAWMGTKSHKDLHKDEDVSSELQSAIGSSFKDFVPQIAKKKSDSLVGYLRKNMPMVSDEEFKRLVSELYGSEYNGPGISSQKKTKEKEEGRSIDGDNVAGEKEKEKEKEKEQRGPDIQEIRIKKLSVLYDGMDSKSQILTSIEDKIVEPVFDKMESADDAEYFAKWWKSFKGERLRDDQEDVESMIIRINSGAMFDDILKNSEVSKKKPQKKIKLRNLMDMLAV